MSLFSPPTPKAPPPPPPPPNPPTQASPSVTQAGAATAQNATGPAAVVETSPQGAANPDTAQQALKSLLGQ